MKLLLIEDEKITRITLTNTLKEEGYDVTAAEDGARAFELIENNQFEIIITDLRLPKHNGLEILEYAEKMLRNVKVIIITAYASVDTAVKALKLGAYDYLIKPFSPDKLISTLNHIKSYSEVITENLRLKQQLKIFENKKIIGSNSKILKVLETVKAVAKNDYTVLIEGESGTGKELIARALHFYSPRVNNEFIPVNCSAIPETLLESELFGYEKGAFTGANKMHKGLFERANGGTIFLDDIDDFPLPLQVKLLRVLQEKEITRIGGNEIIKVNVRVAAATKQNLINLVEKGLFREDLFYRLNIIPLKLPPLRERKEDIPLLTEHFFIKHNAKEKLALLDKNILQLMLNYDWPGNVRELENFVERVIAISEIKGWQKEIELILNSKSYISKKDVNHNSAAAYPAFNKYIREKEIEILTWALDNSKGNISKAADLLDLPRSTFRSKIEKYNLIE